MSKLRRWGLTVVTMASVATLVLLVTGWGSAMASSVSSVLVANTASNPAQVHEAGTANVHVTNTDASGNIKVAEQGTPNVSVQNFPSSQTVNGSVSVSNFPDAATTTEIAGDETVVSANSSAELVPLTDVSRYREITLYLGTPVIKGGSADVSCVVFTGTAPLQFALDRFAATGLATIAIKTYDPAPPDVRIDCDNLDTANDITLDWMLAGRTG